MNGDTEKKEKFSRLDTEADQLLMDGLLTEFGRNGGENDRDFVAQVITAAETRFTAKKKIRAKFIFIDSVAVAAALTVVCSLLYYFSGSAGRKKDIQPCILARSSGGFITADGRKSAIANGMRIKPAAELKIASGNSAFVLFPELSKVEIGAGSDVKFSRLPVSGKAAASGKARNRELILNNGVIEADIVRQIAGGTLTVRTGAGDIMTANARFVLIKSPELCYLEVKQGTVKLKRLGDRSAINIEAGQRCVIADGKMLAVSCREGLIADRMLAARVTEYESRLTMRDKGFIDLLLELNKKAKSDICLRNKLEIINRNFNVSERGRRLDL
ncbi:MAG: hypothetical protein PHV59_12285 [Victivallales bacterium]|nr:hypothetical protein [Victivallales bacterium]